MPLATCYTHTHTRYSSFSIVTVSDKPHSVECLVTCNWPGAVHPRPRYFGPPSIIRVCEKTVDACYFFFRKKWFIFRRLTLESNEFISFLDIQYLTPNQIVHTQNFVCTIVTTKLHKNDEKIKILPQVRSCFRITLKTNFGFDLLPPTIFVGKIYLLIRFFCFSMYKLNLKLNLICVVI